MVDLFGWIQKLQFVVCSSGLKFCLMFILVFPVYQFYLSHTKQCCAVHFLLLSPFVHYKSFLVIGSVRCGGQRVDQLLCNVLCSGSVPPLR